MKDQKKQIKEAVEVLRNGGVVVFPTETSYGLAADATDRRAVERLMRIKGRGSKTLPVIASSLVMFKRYAQIEGVALKLARKFWPGPLTIVLPVRDDKLKFVSPFCVKDKHIAIRVSSNEIARELSRQLGKPIVATSANRSGQPDCYSIRTLRKQYVRSRLQPDFILDAGALPKRKPSTLISIKDEQIKVLRQGSIKIPHAYLS
tara:strand:+ start:158 stop:769 length:612 start_codon:yes stop_codon:yes gene_type:complete